MGSPATGELRPLANGGWEARIRIEAKSRKGFALTAVAGETAARERCTAMALIASRLRAAGLTSKTVEILEIAAKERPGRDFDAVIAAVDMLCGGLAKPAGEPAVRMTVQQLGEDWRSGELHRRFRDHVGVKKDKSVTRDEEFARLYVDKHIGAHAVADVTLDHCELVMSEIPAVKSAALRRGVAQYLRRVLQMAVYPLRLRETNPIPRGWLPRASAEKAKECLYPDEDRALLACTDVPLIRRLFFGMASREGGRTDEQASLVWGDIDLERGRIALDENKTDDPRDWQLDPGVWRALTIWKARFCPDAKPTDVVFVEEGVPINVNRLAYHLRRDLKKAGVTREKLFESSATRRPIRAHDLRATFVTIALATGRTETWVSDRTGHKSSTMLARYRRKARGWNLGTLDPLDAAIPEFAVPHECPMAPASRGVGEQVESPIALQTRDVHDSAVMNPTLNIAAKAEKISGSASHGAVEGQSVPHDPVEAALAVALTEAAKACRFDVVASLAAELQARRLAGSNVATLDAGKRAKR